MKNHIVAAIFFIVFFFTFLHSVNSGDFFHHINTGRYIALTHSLPHFDTWSFSASNNRWIAHSWGSGLLFYFTHSISGFRGISVLFALIGAGTVLLSTLFLKRLGIPPFIRYITAFLAGAIISLRWPSRPEVLAAFFLSFLLYILPVMNHTKKRLALPVFFWAWSIFYGASVFIGIAILALYIVTARKLTKQTALTFILCVIAACGNGYGIQSFLYIFLIPKIAPHVGEWLPITKALDPGSPGVVLFYQYPILIYMLYTIICLALVIMLFFRKRNLYGSQSFYFILFLSFAVPFVSVRFINLAPILCLPAVAIMVNNLTPKYRRMIAILMIILGIGALYVRWRQFDIQTGLNTQSFQSHTVSYLVEHNLSGNIYAPQEISAYITWLLPESRIFVDTRDDAFIGTDVFADLQRLNNGTTDMVSILSKYKADIVIGDVSNQIYTPLFYMNSWRVVYIGESTFIAVRPPIAEKHSLKSYIALDPTRVPPAKPGMITEALNEIGDVLLTNPSDENLVRKAEILLALNRIPEALAFIDMINPNTVDTAKNPITQLGIWEIKAKFYLAAKQCNQAKNALEKAESYRNHPYIFSPTHSLLSAINYYWGMYYISCEMHIPKAREFLIKYAAQTVNSRERKNVEKLLDTLHE